MKFIIIFALLCQLATAASIGILNNNRFDKIVNQIRSRRYQKIVRRTYMQCSTGFRNPRTDPMCRKIAYAMSKVQH